jgi:hypothetical protein
MHARCTARRCKRATAGGVLLIVTRALLWQETVLHTAFPYEDVGGLGELPSLIGAPKDGTHPNRCVSQCGGLEVLGLGDCPCPGLMTHCCHPRLQIKLGWLQGVQREVGCLHVGEDSASGGRRVPGLGRGVAACFLGQ